MLQVFRADGVGEGVAGAGYGGGVGGVVAGGLGSRRKGNISSRGLRNVCVVKRGLGRGAVAEGGK